jgi:hypothetical protein
MLWSAETTGQASRKGKLDRQHKPSDEARGARFFGEVTTTIAAPPGASAGGARQRAHKLATLIPFSTTL